MLKQFRVACRNVYFRRLMLSFSAIALFVSCLCGAVLADKGRRTIDETFARQGTAQLNEVRVYVENMYLNRYKTSLLSDVLSAINPDGQEDALYGLYGAHSPNLYQMFRLVGSLKTAVAADEAINGIYIYFPKMGYVADHDSFYRLSGKSVHAAMLSDLNALPFGRWFGRNLVYGGEVEERLLTYAYTFPAHAAPEQAEGIVWIDLLADKARAILDSQRRHPDEQIWMYSVREQMAIGTSNLSESDLQARIERMKDRSAGGYTSEGTHISLLQASSPQTDWIFASSRPVEETAEAKRELMLQLALVCLGIFALGAALSLVLSLKSYEPVRHMVNRLREMNGGAAAFSQQRNEFKMVDHVLNGLHTTVRQLTSQVDGSKLALLLNGQLPLSELPAHLPPSSHYAVAIVQTTEEEMGLWAARLRRIPSPYPYELIPLGSGQFALLYRVSDAEQAGRRIRDHLAEVLGQGWCVSDGLSGGLSGGDADQMLGAVEGTECSQDSWGVFQTVACDRAVSGGQPEPCEMAMSRESTLAKADDPTEREQTRGETGVQAIKPTEAEEHRQIAGAGTGAAVTAYGVRETPCGRRSAIIGIGSVVDHAERIAHSREQAQRAMRYAFLHEQCALFAAEEVLYRSELPAVAYEPFEQALRAGDVQAVGRFMDGFEAVLRLPRYPLEAVELALWQLGATMSKVLIELNRGETIFGSENLLRDWKEETLQATMAALRERSGAIAAQIRDHVRHQTQYETIHRLKAYIDDHLQEDISLDRLAELASLTPQYISKQFREVLQVSFIEYLTGARMEKACQLLSGSSRSVTDISAQVGFHNVQYFCSKFKAAFGVTPIQYRKSFKAPPEAAVSGPFEP